jgi:transposase
MPDAYRERLRLVIYLYRSGCSATEIGEAIGVTKQRVLQLLRNAGVERRGCGNITRGYSGYATSLRFKERSRRIVALYQSGLSTPEIAETLGCVGDTVIRALRRAGVPRRKGIASHRGYARRHAAETSAA